MADPALRCRGLVKRYPDVLAVAGLDLEVPRGMCFGLLGPNGAGKTTTVEICEGLTPADGGTVEVLGGRWGAGFDRRIRARLGVALQDTQLSERLTVRETLRLFRSFYPAGHGIDETLSRLGLEEKRDARVGKLSGGQRQRLALACALVGAPDLLFLDEPTTGLDPQVRLRIWEIVEAFVGGGGTVILTTHYMEEAARLCHRVAVLDHGKVIAEGSPAELVAGLEAEQVVRLETAPALPESAFADLPGVGSATARGDLRILHVSEIGAALPAVTAEVARRGARLLALTTREATLEDVFVHLTGRGLRDG